MKKGIAPIGPDGESMELHHMIQENEGALAEVTDTFHRKNYDTLHIYPRETPSNVDRSAFDAFRKRYWKNRAKEFKASQ